MKILLYAFVLIGLMSFTQLEHPIYVSTAEIDYNSEAKQLEVAVQIFSDDLQKALTEEQGTSVEIGTDREHPKATELISDYLQRHFKLELNGKNVMPEYVSRRLVREDYFAMWVLLKVPKVKKVRSLKVTNSILVDLYDEQKNFIKYRNQNSSYKRYVTYKSSLTTTIE